MYWLWKKINKCPICRLDLNTNNDDESDNESYDESDKGDDELVDKRSSFICILDMRNLFHGS